MDATGDLPGPMRITSHGCRIVVVCVVGVLLAAASAAAQPFPAEIVYRLQGLHVEVPTALIEASDGNLYGVAPNGYDGQGGSLFRLRPDGLFTELHRFTGGVDGDTPASGLLQAADGNLYGMTVDGGQYGFGTIFRMTLEGQFTVLHAFAGQPDGGSPSGRLIQGSDGSFYGVTSKGGAWNRGTAFRMSSDGVLIPIHHFNYPANDHYTLSPVRGLVEFGGAFYGIVDATWSAKVYRMSLDGATVTFVYDIDLFDGDYSAIRLTGLPTKASDGNLYGAAANSCKGTDGSFYRISPDGAVTQIREFETCTPSPRNELTELRDGSFLVSGGGQLLRVAPTGELDTVRLSDASLSLWFSPEPLLQTSSGDVYGVTDTVIYRLQPKSLTPRVRASPRAPIQISWAPVFAATSYVVKRIGADGQIVVLGQVGGTTFVDATAVPGQHYVYSVSSVGMYGVSDYVEESTVSVVVNRPPVTHDIDGDGRADISLYESWSGSWSRYRSNGDFLPGLEWGDPADLPAPGDYDGDGIMDVAVFRPSTGTWYIRGIATIPWGQPGDTPVPADYDGDGVTDVAVYRRSSGTWYVRGKTPVVWGEKTDVPIPADFDGDGVADIAVYRPATAMWYVRGQAPVAYGIVGDIPVPADYDGDGVADIAVFRRTTGMWFARGLFAIKWGEPGDIPVLLDRDGDGRTELGVYRPLLGNGTWFFKDPLTGTETTRARSGYRAVPIGRPIAHRWLTRGMTQDYDNDGRDDVIVFRSSTATWYILPSDGSPGRAVPLFSGGAPVAADFDLDGTLDLGVFNPDRGMWSIEGIGWTDEGNGLIRWGTVGDIPLPADYDGDGVTDVAVFRPASAVWSILGVGDYNFGDTTDIPVPADYNGDGTTDLAVFRPGTATWYVSGRDPIQFGMDGDIPVPADYDGDGITDIAVFRPSTGTWFVRNQFNARWGQNGDVPIPLDRDGDGRPELIVYRPSDGTWYSNNPATGVVESVRWGIASDIPVGRGAYWMSR